MVDIAVLGGQLYDGRGQKGRLADLSIKEGRIVSLSQPTPSARLVIDARGKVVCPGFIDMHAHSGLKVFTDPVIAPKVRQGITTEVIGVDGISPAPVSASGLINRKRYISAIDGTLPDEEWRWQTFSEYLDALQEAESNPNLLTLIPHGCVRDVVMGLESRPATSSELEQMVLIVEEAFDAGAGGLSLGLNYYPGAYATEDEIRTLVSVAAKRDRVVMVHVRNEGAQLIESLQEMITLGRSLNAKIHISHLKILGTANNHLLPSLLGLLEQASSEGVAISFDQYPYTAGSTQLAYILPPWLHETGASATIERLQSPAVRNRIRQEISSGLPGWENLYHACGPEGIYISYTEKVGNQSCLGHSLAKIAELRGTDALEVVFDLLVEEELRVGMIDHYGDEATLTGIMSSPLHTVCTDGIFYNGYSHPRLYGAFPRVLGRYVRERRILSLSEAIQNMTHRPAQILGLQDRGLLEIGYHADVVIFDPTTICDMTTFEDPSNYPLGVDCVVVNGKPVFINGQAIPARSGQVLRL